MKDSLKTALQIIQTIGFVLGLLVLFLINYKILVLNHRFEEFISNSIIENSTMSYIIQAMYDLNVLPVALFPAFTILILALYHNSIVKKTIQIKDSR